MLSRTNKIDKAQGVVARVLCTSKAIKDALKEKPRAYKDFSRQEMELIIGAPLSAEDYESADQVMLLLMQPQVKCLLNSKPVGKTVRPQT